MASELRTLMDGRHNVVATVPTGETDLVRIGGIDTRNHAVFIDMSREQADRVRELLNRILGD